MNPIISNQLKHCRVAQVPEFDETTTHITIPKISDSNGISLHEGGVYLIELADYILKPYDGFDLHVNWNNNTIPVDKHMKCEIVKIMGPMIRINGVGFDLQSTADLFTTWSGWLPMKGIKILQDLN